MHRYFCFFERSNTTHHAHTNKQTMRKHWYLPLKGPTRAQKRQQLLLLACPFSFFFLLFRRKAWAKSGSRRLGFRAHARPFKGNHPFSSQIQRYKFIPFLYSVHGPIIVYQVLTRVDSIEIWAFLQIYTLQTRRFSLPKHHHVKMLICYDWFYGCFLVLFIQVIFYGRKSPISQIHNKICFFFFLFGPNSWMVTVRAELSNYDNSFAKSPL